MDLQILKRRMTLHFELAKTQMSSAFRSQLPPVMVERMAPVRGTTQRPHANYFTTFMSPQTAAPRDVSHGSDQPQRNGTAYRR
jgi:hypothetical protein